MYNLQHIGERGTIWVSGSEDDPAFTLFHPDTFTGDLLSVLADASKIYSTLSETMQGWFFTAIDLATGGPTKTIISGLVGKVLEETGVTDVLEGAKRYLAEQITSGVFGSVFDSTWTPEENVYYSETQINQQKQNLVDGAAFGVDFGLTVLSGTAGKKLTDSVGFTKPQPKPTITSKDGNMLGANGTKIGESQTIWDGKNGEHIDIENPKPGERPANIHYQVGKQKLVYDPQSNHFYNKVNDIYAPISATQNKKLLSNPEIVKNINKALKRIGE